MGLLNLAIEVTDSNASILGALNLVEGDPALNITKVAQYLAGQVGGRGVNVDVSQAAVAASAVITLSGLPVADETLTVNGVTFTAKAIGAAGDQFNIGVSAAATATNLATAISNSVTSGIAGVVSAAAVGGVVTLTADTAGSAGNSLTPNTESMTNCAITSQWAGGSNSYALTIAAGL